MARLTYEEEELEYKREKLIKVEEQKFFAKCLAKIGNVPIEKQLAKMSTKKSYIAIFNLNQHDPSLSIRYGGRSLVVATNQTILGFELNPRFFETNHCYYGQDGSEINYGQNGWQKIRLSDIGGRTILGLVPEEYEDECRENEYHLCYR